MKIRTKKLLTYPWKIVKWDRADKYSIKKFGQSSIDASSIEFKKKIGKKYRSGIRCII